MAKYIYTGPEQYRPISAWGYPEVLPDRRR